MRGSAVGCGRGPEWSGEKAEREKYAIGDVPGIGRPDSVASAFSAVGNIVNHAFIQRATEQMGAPLSSNLNSIVPLHKLLLSSRGI